MGLPIPMPIVYQGFVFWIGDGDGEERKKENNIYYIGIGNRMKFITDNKLVQWKLEYAEKADCRQSME
jgi:hypothetical protein